MALESNQETAAVGANSFSDLELMLTSAGFVALIVCCGGCCLFFFWRRKAEKLRTLNQSQMERVKAKRKARASVAGGSLYGGQAPENLPSAPTLTEGEDSLGDDMDHWLSMRMGMEPVLPSDLETVDDLLLPPMRNSSEILASARANHKASVWEAKADAPAKFVPSQVSRRSLDMRFEDGEVVALPSHGPSTAQRMWSHARNAQWMWSIADSDSEAESQVHLEAEPEAFETEADGTSSDEYLPYTV